MSETLTYKEEFIRKRDQLFKKHSRQHDALKFSKEYSLWIEETIRELAGEIIKLTNSRSKLNFSRLPDDDPSRRRPDIALAKEKLSWEPEIDIEIGLKKTIEFFKNIIDV